MRWPPDLLTIPTHRKQPVTSAFIPGHTTTNFRRWEPRRAPSPLLAALFNRLPPPRPRSRLGSLGRQSGISDCWRRATLPLAEEFRLLGSSHNGSRRGASTNTSPAGSARVGTPETGDIRSPVRTASWRHRLRRPPRLAGRRHTTSQYAVLCIDPSTGCADGGSECLPFRASDRPDRR